MSEHLIDWETIADKAERRLMATPWELLGPAGKILVSEALERIPAPNPILTDGPAIREAEPGEQKPNLEVELLVIDAWIERLQIRRQFVTAELR